MKMAPVRSLAELRFKAGKDENYKKLAIMAAQNLGGTYTTLDEAMRWLETNATETDEEGVVEEINFVRDLV